MLREELENILQEEKRLYLGNDNRQIKQKRISHHKRYTIWRYLYYFRLCQYWNEVRKQNSLSRIERQLVKIRFRYYDKKRNIYSEKSGVEIGISCKIGKNCDIWHSGVVINGTVGDDCIFHGNNIIGNKGKNHENESPTIRNRVDIGAGAIIIGQLEIANDCVVGAGAVLTRSFLEPASVIVGVPGRKMN